MTPKHDEELVPSLWPIWERVDTLGKDLVWASSAGDYDFEGTGDPDIVASFLLLPGHHELIWLTSRNAPSMMLFSHQMQDDLANGHRTNFGNSQNNSAL